MIILSVAAAMVFLGMFITWALDVSKRIDTLDSYKGISSTNIHQIKSALESAQKKIESIDRKAQTAYDMANNSMLREKREITVRLKRIKSVPKISSVKEPPPLLKKSGLTETGVWG